MGCAGSKAGSVVDAPPAVQIALETGQSVILPTKELQRVFIGLGWSNKTSSGGNVDLDCSIVGFGPDGSRDESSTVYFGRLFNESHATKGGASSIVHTGDILKGKDGQVEEDMERIYVWLSELPAHLATIAFEADVFTNGLNFSALSNAFVRLVNADTNQELCRLTLTEAALGPVASSRVVLLARIRKLTGAGTDGFWSLESAAEPRGHNLRACSGPQADMTQIVVQQGLAVMAGAPPAAVAQMVADTDVPEPPKTQAPPRPKKAWRCPALAVATGAGVAAATAIFLASPASPLNGDMLAGELFTSGVDFSAMSVPDVSGAGDFFADGLEGTSDAMVAVGDSCLGCCGGAAEHVSRVAADAPELLSNAADKAGEVAEAVKNTAGELAVAASTAASTLAVTAGEYAEQAVAAAGPALETVKDNAAQVVEVGGKVVKAAVETVGSIV